MPWPTMSDYQDALQNPRLSFSDPELQKGVPVTDRLGLPKPITGGFASVYQVDCGDRKWAVRCFLRYHQDMEQRYASIGRCLQEARLPYTAGFQYMRNGIKVRGEWVPALKMEWVDGEPLNLYVERIRNDREALLRLAQQFSCMSRDLRRCNIAHGDLQHGNIMVMGGAMDGALLRLVDYDGMYVPQLRGMPSHEIGHPNYQHPLRSERDFGPYLDNFSEWVIYLSIVALSVQPELWDSAGGGDEQLLFARADFRDPKSSKVLRALSESSSESLRQMAGVFRSVLLCSDISRIPVIGDSHAPVGGQSSGSSSGRANGNLPAWVLDHMDTPRVELGPPFTGERASVVSSVLLALVLARFAYLGHIAAAIAGWGSVAGLTAAAAFIVVRYRGRTEYLNKASLLAQAAGAKREIRRLEGVARYLEREKDRILQREARAVQRLNVKIARLSSREREELAEVDKWLDLSAGAVIRRREGLDREEEDELATVARSTPVLFLGKRARSIMKRYRSKRESLQKQEDRAQAEALRNKEAVRVKYRQKSDPLARRLQEVRSGFASDRAQIDEGCEQASRELALQKWCLQDLTRELSLYSGVRLVAFVRKILFL